VQRKPRASETQTRVIAVGFENHATVKMPGDARALDMTGMSAPHLRVGKRISASAL
jgi:hypothetical protein